MLELSILLMINVAIFALVNCLISFTMLGMAVGVEVARDIHSLFCDTSVHRTIQATGLSLVFAFMGHIFISLIAVRRTISK